MSIVLDQPTTQAPTSPGLYPNVPFEEYLSWPYASQSLLTTIRDRSPLHAWEEKRNPSPSTPAQRLGDAVHRAVLQPDLFVTEFVRGIEGDGRTKAVKEAREALAAEHPLATVLTPDEYDQCIAMRDAVRNHPTASKLLAGEAERSAVWRDRSTGVMCKGRFDDINRNIPALIDLKTTRDASKNAFMRAIATYGYYLQASFYNQGAHELGLDPRFFIIIAVENVRPYAVAVYQIMDKALVAGEHELGMLLETYRQCQESGVWPGYPEAVEEISLPGWAIYNIEERLGVEL